jgi:hypothetical protein
MAKNRSIVLDSKRSATEADPGPAVEGGQTNLLSESEPGARGDAVRNAAYALYEARQGIGGSEEDDWLQAESQIAQIASSGV